MRPFVASRSRQRAGGGNPAYSKTAGSYSSSMTELRYSVSTASFLKDLDHLLVVGRRDRIQHLGKVGPFTGLRDILSGLLDQAVTGRMGCRVSSLTGKRPGLLTLGILPDETSRYNSPSLAESIRRISGGAGLEEHGKGGLLLLLRENSHLPAALNAVGRAFPLFDARSQRRKRRRALLRILALGPSGRALRVPPWVRETVACTRAAARWVDLPPGELYPEAFAQEARRFLRGLPSVKLRVIRGPKLLEAGLGGLEAVGRAAGRGPCLFLASYDPPGAKGEKTALVGKGITFDSGGLCLKGRTNLLGMKGDMGGAAAVLGAFRVLVSAGIARRLRLVLCLAENAIGPKAFRPDDILMLHSGKSVEVNNTDAEGRLVLADGVSYAARVLGAGLVLDAATLTGAQLVATGRLHAAIVSNDPSLEEDLVRAGRESGDLVHPLPFAPEFYRSEFKSPVADMRNSVKDRMNAQTSCAAEFIHAQIEDCGVRWGHVDLAGPSVAEERGTGFGVALLSRLLLGN